MMKQRKINQSPSSESISYSFLANMEKCKENQNSQSKAIELNNIKQQADLILKNIENQIESINIFREKECQTFKFRTTLSNHNGANENTRQFINIQSRPTTAIRNNKTLPRPVTATQIYQKLTPKQDTKQPIKKPLDLNQLCNNEVSMGNFKLESILGTGSYATVRLSQDKQSKERFAIKIYDKTKLNDQQKMNNVKREISLLKRINHPNIIKLVYAIEDRKSINLVMEFISSTSLASYVKTKPSRTLQQKEGIFIFHQIAKAVKYLHDKNIAHRDIKLENILLMKDNYVKLIDFGFSICIQDGQKLNVFCGTPSYMSPEIVSKTPHSPLGSDIWSLGILLSKILTGEYPFKGTNDRDLYRSIQCAKWKSHNKLDDDIIRIIKGCLDKNLNQRWNIDQIINDPLFTNNNDININIYNI